MEKVRWGVLGAAAIARTRTVPAMALAPSVTLAALASRSLDRAEVVCAELAITTAYGSYEELLADSDAVYLPLPNHLHCQWACRRWRPANTCRGRSRCASRSRKSLCCKRFGTGRVGTSRRRSSSATIRSGRGSPNC